MFPGVFNQLRDSGQLNRLGDKDGPKWKNEKQKTTTPSPMSLKLPTLGLSDQFPMSLAPRFACGLGDPIPRQVQLAGGDAPGLPQRREGDLLGVPGVPGGFGHFFEVWTRLVVNKKCTKLGLDHSSVNKKCGLGLASLLRK